MGPMGMRLGLTSYGLAPLSLSAPLGTPPPAKRGVCAATELLKGPTCEGAARGRLPPTVARTRGSLPSPTFSCPFSTGRFPEMRRPPSPMAPAFATSTDRSFAHSAVISVLKPRPTSLTSSLDLAGGDGAPVGEGKAAPGRCVGNGDWQRVGFWKAHGGGKMEGGDCSEDAWDDSQGGVLHSS